MIKAYKDFWVHILDFSGRTGRKNYWWAIVINYVLSGIIITVIDNFLSQTVAISDVDGANILLMNMSLEVIIILTWLATLSVRVRRLHDTKRSGWWVLLQPIPVIGTIWFFVLMVLPTKGDANEQLDYYVSKRKLALMSVLVVALSLGSVIWKNLETYGDEAYEASQVKKWTAEQHALLTDEQFNQMVSKYSDKKITGMTKGKNRTVIIPGLRGAWSINHDTKDAAFGTNWVPQGLTETKEQYLISAYDGNHRLNSVIFLVNKDTGKYQKTIILSTKSHVGGLAVDKDHGLLWVSNDTKAEARIEAISLTDMAKYDAAKTEKPIKATQNAKLPWASKVSGLSYYKNNLAIVKYGKNKSVRSVTDIEVDHKSGLVTKKTMQGAPIPDEVTTLKGVADILKKNNVIKSYTPGYDRMQGFSVVPSPDDNWVIALYTQSNGDSASKLIMQSEAFNNGQLNFNNKSTFLASLYLPPSVEQVSADPSEKQISLLFEGAAAEYSKFRFGLFRAPFIDRLVIFNYGLNK
ncbi:DUF805 domain-containing protein [Dellaglioa carnosa]|uniref:DUF805 domain-containing protein n=1 Tax=Dellaglioa carnosa TaxID=2995136 RepID=A0ABT4JM35_9LACO|nr:DUF805 domain-containing protein [Dellaglioa carnosa]MCZ2491414.1 DUF805 domain-containing protein [Dellaglioa carnosa]MCZ2494492.1 DUF805 domain-containing protein [Dellaglioa carnosa]MDK1731092.1 DUF805 domain-containing protein [Dellaglioa carnosa]